MRLNVGCGEFLAAGWTNMDMVVTDIIHPDLVMDLYDLPDSITGLTAVYCGHVMEHIPPERIVAVLSDLRARMVSGAGIACVGPDIDRATAMYSAGQMDKATFDMCHAHVGDKQWFGDYHYWACRESELAAYMQEAGFSDVHAVPLDSAELDPYPVTSRVAWQCAVVGTA